MPTGTRVYDASHRAELSAALAAAFRGRLRTRRPPLGARTSLGMSYSRYADDLTFSGPRHTAGVLKRAVAAIVRLRLNPAKARSRLEATARSSAEASSTVTSTLLAATTTC